MTERLPGQHLGTVWGALPDREKRRAALDLWRRVRLVGGTDVDVARRAGCVDTPFYALDAGRAAGQLAALGDAGWLDRQMVAALAALLERDWRVVGQVGLAVNHTDAGLHNAVWDGVSAVPVDFEFACVAPADLDMEALIRFAVSAGSDVREGLGEVVGPSLASSAALDRLIAYGVLRDVWALGVWVSHAGRNWPRGEDWPPRSVEEWTPWANLRDHVAGRSPVLRLV